jgi:enamine deaminase RidA (YjgF/YER057c/UK114 family)
VERLNISSGSPYESVLGYSRAVCVGPHIFVAGTAPIMPGGADPPPDAYGQTRRCLEIIGAALEQAGAGLEHVVRTRVYLTRLEDFDEFGRAHGEVFGEIRPVNTTILAAGLVDSRWLVEIEAEAVIASEPG